MKEKLSRRVKRAVADELDYPLESMEQLSVLHITSNELVVAESCRGILNYSTEKMILDMREHVLTIFGRELVITELTAFGVAIKGEVFTLSFDKRSAGE